MIYVRKPKTAGGPKPILDQITSPANAAFSFRKLRSAYTGDCCRVTNSGATALDIGFSGDYLDVSALTTHLGGGSGTITMYDQSGNGYDLENTVGAPSIQLGAYSTQTGLYCVYLNGTSALHTNNYTGAFSQNDVDIYIVGHKSGSSFSTISAYTIALSNTASAYTADVLSSTQSRSYIGGVQAVFTIAMPNEAYWSRSYRDGAGADVNGVIYVESAGVNNNYSIANADTEIDCHYILMGCNRVSTLASAFTGDFFEMIYFNETLSSADSTLLEADQKSFYNL